MRRFLKAILKTMRRIIISLVALVGVILLAQNVRSQLSPYSPSKAAIQATQPGVGNQLPQTYSNYYSKQLKSYHRPPTRPADYTIDRMYQQNPNISPYLNLTRRPSRNVGMNNYYRYVRPELERRQTLTADPRRTSGAATSPRNYYNQFYGGP